MRNKSIYLLFIIIAIFIVNIQFIYVPKNTSAQWESDNFNENIEITWTPQQPFNFQNVNVTISSKHGQAFNAANLFLKTGGGWAFSFVNNTDTAMSATIPGSYNRGGTTVNFYVAVYDIANTMITSENYHYDVIKNGTWEYPLFTKNIDLTYSPRYPTPTDEVEVVIMSKASRISINNAYLYYVVNLPEDYDMPALRGTVYFERINLSAMRTTIIPYPSGSSISFWVEAFDQYNTMIRSSNYVYDIPIPPPVGPEYQGQIAIIVYDLANNKYPDDLKVSISNKTMNATYQTLRGVVWTNWMVLEGKYEITVEYKGEKNTRILTVNELQKLNGTVKFEVNEKTLGVPFEFEEFPIWYAPWYVYVAFLLLILLIPFLWFGYKKRERIEKKVIRNPLDTDNEKTEGKTAFNLFLDSFKSRFFGDEKKKMDSTQFLAFFGLGLVGAVWAPFYPWWLVLTIGFVIAAIGYKFPYLALIILTLTVLGATAYQAPEFGFIFLIFSLVVLVCALFNWKFGFLVFFTIFLSRIGIAFIVPCIAVMLYSLLIGIAVAVVSGIFLVFLVNLGNFTNLSFLISSPHSTAFITFSRSVKENFWPTHYIEAITGMFNNIDPNMMITIFNSNFNSMIPFIEVIVWCIALLILSHLIKHKIEMVETEAVKELRLKDVLIPSTYPGVLISFSALGSTLAFEYWGSVSPGFMIFLIAIIGAIYFSVCFSFMIRRVFPNYFMAKTGVGNIGTRISDMPSFRQASFKTVGGLEDTKEELKEAMIVPLLETKLAKKYRLEPSKGILLFGPPGCGKTLLMRAIATELNVEMISVKCSDIMSKWYGESEGLIDNLFKNARLKKPCILFLDEIDAITKRRDFYSTDDVTPRILSIMLAELDGMDEATGVIIVGTTNMPDMIDPALLRPGRFDKIIYIPPPDLKSRINILKIHLKGRLAQPEIDLEGIASKTEGFSGADLANVIKEASIIAMRRALKTQKQSAITTEDFYEVLPSMKTSITEDMLKQYEKLRKEHERKKHRKPVEKIEPAKKLDQPPVYSIQPKIQSKVISNGVPQPTVVNKTELPKAQEWKSDGGQTPNIHKG